MTTTPPQPPAKDLQRYDDGTFRKMLRRLVNLIFAVIYAVFATGLAWVVWAGWTEHTPLMIVLSVLISGLAGYCAMGACAMVWLAIRPEKGACDAKRG